MDEQGRRTTADWWVEQNPVLGQVDWEKYFGNNHHQIPESGIHLGGHVDFGYHIGKKLSLDLWQDLLYRLDITGICIYRPRSLQWMLGWGPGHCLVHLDDDDRVRRICLVPFARPRPVKVPNVAVDADRVITYSHPTEGGGR